MMNGPEVKTITCGELFELSQSVPITLIDVRTPEEFHERCAAGARNVPLDSQELRDLLNEPTFGKAEPVYFICEVGGRSAFACAAFMAAGRPNVINVEGGTRAWAEVGLPLASIG
jgi:rhodanese-related sulfurtransferase